MRVLFLSIDKTGDGGSAYANRLEKLRGALEARGIETICLNLRDFPFSRPLLAHPLNAPWICAALRGADFVHAGGPASYTATFLRNFIRARIIFDVHGDAVYEAKMNFRADRSLRKAFWVPQASFAQRVGCRGSDHFLVVSEYQRRRLEEGYEIHSKQTAVVRNGVDLTDFQQQRESTRNNFTVSYAGGFQAWQGIENLVRAAERLTNPKIKVEIIGFTQNQAALKRDINRRLGDRAVLLDRMPQRELARALSSSDVLIIPRPASPAVKVAFPTKFAEYLALGKPVIVCDVDETATFVRKHQCGFVALPDPDSIADTIHVAGSATVERLREMGANGRHLAAREFSWDVIGERYHQQLLQWSIA